uniref:FH2 domain-containing protein n=1 Tax=Ascaris lumbricoides TaxID=6252 RepID=A0A0M3IMJ9_ASCLU
MTSFVPTVKGNKDARFELIASIHKVANVIKWKELLPNGEDSEDLVKQLAISCPLQKIRTTAPPPNPDIDRKINLICKEAQVLYEAEMHSIRRNLSKQSYKAIRELKEPRGSGHIRISVSDKGGDFVVITQQLDKQIALRGLANRNMYELATVSEFNSFCKEIKIIWETVKKRSSVNDELAKRLSINHPVCRVIYFLLKTHKIDAANINTNDLSAFKVRPIVSAVGGPAEGTSWFLS